jgi:hypothetical protein
MGLPAVNIHYAQYSIPTALITYDEILRAGVLPTVGLVVVGAYLYWAHKESRTLNSSGHSSLLLQVVIWPILLPVLLIVLAAFVSMYVLLFWGVLRLLTYPLGYFDIPFSDRDLLKGAAALIVPLIGVILWMIRRSEDETRSGPTAAADVAAQVEQNDPATNLMMMLSRSPRDVHVDLLAKGVFVILLGLVLLALSVKVVVWLWNPAWSDLFTYSHAIWAATIVGVLYLASMLLLIALEWLADADGSKRVLGFVTVSVILSAAYVSLAAYYSYRIYPWLPRGLGGGRADAVVVQVATDASLGLPTSSECVAAGATVVRCQGLLLFLVDDEKVVLVTRPGRSMEGVLLSRDVVHTIAWSQPNE